MPLAFVVAMLRKVLSFGLVCLVSLLACEGGRILGANNNSEPKACVPSSCEEVGLECGEASDRCGGTLSCGVCPAACTAQNFYLALDDQDGDQLFSVDPSIVAHTCYAPKGYTRDIDCNDNEKKEGPAKIFFVDGDLDGFGGSLESFFCASAVGDGVPIGSAIQGGDCDDGNENLYKRVKGFLDVDGDGFGSSSNCVGDESRVVSNSDDCNDSDASRFRTGNEFYDADGDGHGANSHCLGKAAGADNGTDCDDSDPTVFVIGELYPNHDGDSAAAPNPIPICWNGQTAPLGYSSAPGTDCNDMDARAYPEQTAAFSEPMQNMPPTLEYDFNCDGKNTLTPLPQLCFRVWEDNGCYPNLKYEACPSPFDCYIGIPLTGNTEVCGGAYRLFSTCVQSNGPCYEFNQRDVGRTCS